MYNVPPPNLLYNMPNVSHRGGSDSQGGRWTPLFENLHTGYQASMPVVVQRVYGGDPVVTIQATSFTVAGTRNMVPVQGSLPGPSTHYIGPVNVNGYTPML